MTGQSERTRTVGIELAADLLRAGKPVDIVVGGRSMWPLLRDGDVVRLEPTQSIRVGDVAAIWRDGHLVVHRVASIEPGVVRMRGDNLASDDAPVRASEVLGVVRVHRRGAREVRHDTTLARGLNRLVAGLSRRARLPWRVARLLARLG